MYTNISELPTQVLASLDNRDATKWMKTYNASIRDGTDISAVMKARQDAWMSVKDAPSSFSFCIKASVEAIDKDREVIDIDSIKKHMDSYIQYGGNVQNEHGNYNVGCIWAWDPIVDNGLPGIKVWGNIFGGDQVYDQARQAFIKGRNNLSVAGEATMGRYQCDFRGCYMRRNVKQLLEISLCDVPANRLATMLWYNKGAKLTKSQSAQEQLRLNVNEYSIHKDYHSCPIQALKKSLLDAGFQNVHARESGVEIYCTPIEADRMTVPLIKMGLSVAPIPDGLQVQNREELIKDAFTRGYDQGYITKTGKFTKSMPQSAFDDLFMKGLVDWDDNGNYRLCKQ